MSHKRPKAVSFSPFISESLRQGTREDSADRPSLEEPVGGHTARERAVTPGEQGCTHTSGEGDAARAGSRMHATPFPTCHRQPCALLVR